MSAITRPHQMLLEQTRRAVHPLCVACSRARECGLGLRFTLHDEGRVEARFECTPAFQGYEGILHGGITSALLDSAMTNCLFAHGIAAVTAEISVRFRHPIEVGSPLIVQARMSRLQKPLHVVEAEVIQNGQVKARAVGRFMEQTSGP